MSLTPEDIAYLSTCPPGMLYAKLPDGTDFKIELIGKNVDKSGVELGITNFNARTGTEIRVSYTIFRYAVVDGVVKTAVYMGSQSIEASKETIS